MIDSIEKINELYFETFFTNDKGIIPLIAAITIATRTETDPVWLLIIGPPGNGKSEIISILYKVPFVHQVSNLTENTLLSGMKSSSGETSLLKKIGSNGMIVMKDYTTILSMRSERKEMVEAQMREVFDGYMTKKTGNGNDPEWRGKINFIGAVTEEIYAHGSMAAKGMRALNYVMDSSTDKVRKLMAVRARKNTHDIGKKRADLQEAFKEYIAYFIKNKLPKPGEEIKLPDQVENDIIDLCNFATKAMSSTSRNYRGELELVHSATAPTRMSQEIFCVAEMFFAMFDGKIPEYCMKVLYKLAIDTIPKQRRIVIEALTRYQSTPVRALAEHIGYPEDTVMKWLEDLNSLGVISRRKDVGNNSLNWYLKDEYKQLFARFTETVMTEESLSNEGLMDTFDSFDAAF